jgi:hypothetical protein
MARRFWWVRSWSPSVARSVGERVRRCPRTLLGAQPVIAGGAEGRRLDRHDGARRAEVPQKVLDGLMCTSGRRGRMRGLGGPRQPRLPCHAAHAFSSRSWRASRSGLRRGEGGAAVEVGVHYLCEVFERPRSSKPAAACATARGSSSVGTTERCHAARGPGKSPANEVGLPAARLDQPGVRDAAGFGASERERDELDGATERFDRRVPADFWPPSSWDEETASR